MKQTIILTVLLAVTLLADVGTLKKVVDGDTLYFHSRGHTVKCRIAYIDTPESHRNSRAESKAGVCVGVTLDRMVGAGKEAARHAGSLVSVGKSYRFDVRGHDRYGRAICVVRLPDGETYNEGMVRDGYAVPFWKYIPSSMKRRYGTLAKEAKRRHNGLWREYRPVMECLLRR